MPCQLTVVAGYLFTATLRAGADLAAKLVLGLTLAAIPVALRGVREWRIEAVHVEAVITAVTEQHPPRLLSTLAYLSAARRNPAPTHPRARTHARMTASEWLVVRQAHATC